MSDFYQRGPITTLHRLSGRPVEELEKELLEWTADASVAVVVPCLASELDGPALPRIVDVLADLTYIDEVIVGLDGADPDTFARARRLFGRLPQRHRILWHDGPRLTEFEHALAGRGLAPINHGKGRNVWFCLGYVLAGRRIAAVALHDADIVSYQRDLLARLLYPIMHPTFGYEAVKGYYYRVTGNQLGGRVTRLLVGPLVRALTDTVGGHAHLEYLGAFRYPLAGEYALRVELLESIRLPSDWGLEIGMLLEVRRTVAGGHICQVELPGPYDHKHSEVSAGDPRSDLRKMATDVSRTILGDLVAQGVVLSAELLHAVDVAYHRRAMEDVERYQHDAEMNGYAFDRSGEQGFVDVFARAVVDAAQDLVADPMGSPPSPSWSQVASVIPDAGGWLLDAVEADHLT